MAKWTSKSRFAGGGFGPGVYQPIAHGRIISPRRNQTPAQEGKLTVARFRVDPHDRNLLSRGDVVAWLKGWRFSQSEMLGQLLARRSDGVAPAHGMSLAVIPGVPINSTGKDCGSSASKSLERLPLPSCCSEPVFFEAFGKNEPRESVHQGAYAPRSPEVSFLPNAFAKPVRG